MRKTFKKIILPVIGIALILCLMCVSVVVVNAAAQVNAYESSSDHSAQQIEKGGGELGMRINVNEELLGFGIAMPTWCTEGSTCDLSLYYWNETYKATLEGEPVATVHVECRDNATNWLNLEEAAPAGEYLCLIHNVSGTVGAWVHEGTSVSKGFLYENGVEMEKELEMKVKIGNKTTEPFLQCASAADYVDGNHTAPEEYVVPEDSLIKTHEVMPDTWVFTDALGRTS